MAAPAKATTPRLHVTDSGKIQDQYYHAQASSRAMGLLMRRSMDHRRSKQSKHKRADDRFTDAEIAFAGNLTKQGSFWRTWRKRYFILRRDRPMLCYYTSSKELTKLGEMTLDATTVVETVEASSSSCFFSIKTKQRKLIVNASEGGNEYMHAWIDALHAAVASCRTSVPFAFKNAVPISDHENGYVRGRKSSGATELGKLSVDAMDDAPPPIVPAIHEVAPGSPVSATADTITSPDYRASVPCFAPDFFLKTKSTVRDDSLGMRRAHSLNDLFLKTRVARTSDSGSHDNGKPVPTIVAGSWTDRNHSPSLLSRTAKTERPAYHGFGLNSKSLSLVNVRPPDALHFAVSFGSIEKVPHSVPLLVVLSVLNWDHEHAQKKQAVTEVARTEVECTNHLRLCGDRFVRDFQALLSVPHFLVEPSVVLQLDVYSATNAVTESLKHHKLLGYFTIAAVDLIADSDDGTPLVMDLRHDGRSTTDILGSRNFLVLEQVATSPVYELAHGYTFATHQYLVDTSATVEADKAGTRGASNTLVTEEMSASYCSLTVVLAFVQMLQARNTRRTAETRATLRDMEERDLKKASMTSPLAAGAVSFADDDDALQYDSYVSIRSHLTYLDGLKTTYDAMERRYRALALMVDDGAEHGITSCLKRSTMKKDPTVEFMPTNLVCHLLRAQTPSHESHAWATITHGCAAAHLLGFKDGGLRRLLQNGAADPAKLEYRRDIVTCQLLAIVTATFVSYLQLAADDAHDGAAARLRMLVAVGFLVDIESLLSTAGNEKGMLEDMAEGVKWINDTPVCFEVAPAAGGAARCVSIETGIATVLRVALPTSTFAKLPLVFQRQPRVRLRAVLFTQGINEMQSVANTVGDTSVQEEINVESLAILATYVEQYLAVGARDEAALLPLTEIRANLATVVAAVESQKKSLKNINVLVDSSYLCRLVGAGRTTCCKSGKDRTAMSVTLEFTRLLVDSVGVKQGMCLCQAMRERGVRRTNVLVNTGKTMYAFNTLQLKCLPACYKPPPATANANVAS
ncbi:inositol-3,4-bisphosphate 4-phosphatase [Achlya hypogyna]|uniref:Inositol-3,4-bisphosphate 4-phosphatase n=1 Tax=Achlya hypogyna TaxID=1202772 RepID=A0A1V9YIF0_ACHHY|nr:inositol-3,4-bisphosphate 4-phosphatase [Achlya hypogyna]